MAAEIAEYLDRLDHELRLKRAPRRRLLAEVEDHLRSSALELGGDVSEDEAELAAVERFGAAATVARRFAHAVAARSARRSAGWLGVAFAGYAALLVVFMATARPEFADFPQGAPSALALQIAALAVAVSLIRSRRWRGFALVPEDRVRFLADGAVIGATSLGLGLLLEAMVAATRPAGVLPWDGLPLVATLYGVSTLGALAAALSAASAAFRSSTLAAIPGTEMEGGGRLPGLVDDVGALVPAARRPVAAAFARPKLLVGGVAAGALTAVVVSQLLGHDFARHASIALPALALGLLEATLILAGYMTLGRRLGLRGGAAP